MLCKNCGKEIDDKAVICINCGCAVDQQFEKIQKRVPNEADKVSVLSILGFCLALVGWAVYGVGIFLEIAALVMSIIGVVNANKTGKKLKGLGVAGIIISSILIGLILILWMVGLRFLTLVLDAILRVMAVVAMAFNN